MKKQSELDVKHTAHLQDSGVHAKEPIWALWVLYPPRSLQQAHAFLETSRENGQKEKAIHLVRLVISGCIMR